MKKKILLAVTLLCVIALTVSLASCGKSSKTTGQTLTYTAQNGNISVDITAAGNLDLSTVQDLTFALFYQKGTVASVNVSVGDTVTKDEVLASLDAAEWADQIQSLEDALTAAQQNVTAKQRALTTAQRQVYNDQQAITTAQNQVTAKQLALRQAQLNLQNAQYNLAALNDIKEQQDIIDRDTALLDVIAANLEESKEPSANPLDFQFWTNENARVNAELAAAQKELKAILAGDSINVSTTVEMQVASFQLAIDQAQANIDSANQALTVASTSVTNAQQDLTFAQQDAATAQAAVDTANKAVATAQENLTSARAASPDIVAPFDGFVTKVNAAGGDQVLNGAVIIEVADPNKFQANILVSESNITKVAVGGDATVTLDAITGLTLPAKVTKISPTATIQSSVVNYSVTVELESLAQLAASANTTGLSGFRRNFSGSDNITGNGNFPNFSGNVTGNGNFPNFSGNVTAGGNFPGFTGSDNTTTGNRLQSTISTLTEEISKLRQGMSATVSLIVQQVTNVLEVPYAAVTVESGKSYVNVVGTDGKTEKREVTTGLTNYSFIEIKSGLTAGEKVNYTLGTTSSSASSTNTFRTGGGTGAIGGIFGGR